MSDATTAAPAAEVTAPAAVETPPSAAETAPEAEADIIEAAADRLSAEGAEAAEAEKPEAQEAEGAEKPAEQKTAKQLDAADEALFSDKALSTAAGVKAGAARVREMHAELAAGQKALTNKQRTVDHDFRVLKNREAKFKTTKDQHVSWFNQQRSQAQMLGQHVNVLRSGTPAQVIESLGFLTGKDGMAFYEEIVTNAAGLRKAPAPELEAMRRDYERRFAELEERAQSAQTEAQIGERQRQVAELEQKALTAASDATAYPTLSQYAGIRPREVLSEIKTLRKAHRDATGESLPMAEAMLQLDRQLALLLRQGGGGAGNPQLEESQNPGGKPSQSSTAKKPGSVAGIPPSASTRVAPVRAATEEERRQELTPEFYDAIGLG